LTGPKRVLGYTIYSYDNILHTAIDAYNLSYTIFIYENAVASFNETGHEWALGHFKGSLGATIL
jgi:nicotinamidase-related amidase